MPGQFNGFQCHDGNPIGILRFECSVMMPLYQYNYAAYLRDEERSCEKQVSPLALSCTSLSTPWINGDIAVARVNTVLCVA